MVTRTGLVVKIGCFSPQNGDENEARRQNNAVFTSKWRRELVSSPKLSDFHFKVVTRLSLVAKKWSFRPKNDDEKWPRRPKMDFLA
ncbi:hypothetical protein NST89_03280 [Caldifermentibacillus hisashii]|uniref:hypothetical protein n=1 Tax=Caldifermentibacillus hisashii TaxID=996558 RepID=UPI003136474B